MTFTTFLILTLAAYRLSRLIIEDTITEPVRDWILGRWPGRDVKYDEDDYVKGGTVRVGSDLYAAEPTSAGDKIAKLLGCHWCLGFHASWLIVGAYWLWPTVMFWLALVGAVSALVGIVGVLMAADE